MGWGHCQLSWLGITLKPSAFCPHQGSASQSGASGSQLCPCISWHFLSPASAESMPVWEQDVEEQLSALDSLIAQPLAAAPGAREQQRLRR